MQGTQRQQALGLWHQQRELAARGIEMYGSGGYALPFQGLHGLYRVYGGQGYALAYDGKRAKFLIARVSPLACLGGLSIGMA